MGGPRLPESSDRIIWSPVINSPNSTCCVGSINSCSVKWKRICGCEFWSQMEHLGWSVWCFFAGLSTILSVVCACAWVYTMNWPIKKVNKSINAANLFNEIPFTLKPLCLNPRFLLSYFVNQIKGKENIIQSNCVAFIILNRLSKGCDRGYPSEQKEVSIQRLDRHFAYDR